MVNLHHVKTMLETFNELSIVGDAITDEDRIVCLLASLPESFDMLVTVLESKSYCSKDRDCDRETDA